MEAGLTEHVWSLEELAEMIEETLPKPAKRGAYETGAYEKLTA